MFTLRQFLSCAVGIIAASTLPLAAFSQQSVPKKAAPRTITVPLVFKDFTSKKLYVLRGDKVRFSGDCTPYLGGLNVILRAGGVNLASNLYETQCDLQWDSAHETFTGRRLFLFAAKPAGREGPVGQFDVTILEKMPFDFSAAPENSAKGRYAIHIKALSDLEAASFTLYCDNKPTAQTVMGSGEGTVDLSAIAPGNHEFCFKARLKDGGELDVGGFAAEAPTRVALALDSPTSVIDLSSGRTVVHLTVTLDGDIAPISAEYVLDERTIVVQSGKLSSISIDLSHAASGPHHVAVTLLDKDGNRFPSPAIAFTVQRDKASDYQLWKDRFQGYIDRQAADTQSLVNLLQTRYEGRKQTSAAIESIRAMMKRNETAAADIAALDWPITLEDEDQRTLRKSRKALVVSFQGTQEVTRKLLEKLTDLLRYDGTLVNAPGSFDFLGFRAREGTNLSNAGQFAASAIEGLALIERRGNIK